MQHINWDNLRYVLMVANKGSIAAAARELEVNRTTVLRRINKFQENLNCRIFDRGDTGYVLTPEAEKMIKAAREVENTLFDMQRQIAGHELKLEGELRVTTTDSFMLSVLGPHLATFRQKHPHIVVDILVTNSLLDLTRRDADVAIRPTREPEASLVGRRLCDVEFGVYAVPGFDKTIKQRNVCLRCDSFVAIRIAAEAGIGLALMPRFLGDDSSELVRLPLPADELTTGLWILTHPDLVRSARVNAFIQHFTEALSVP
jgi:DNA-binding transcriptional LysR family regulator